MARYKFSERIHDLRVKQGLSIGEFARSVEVTSKTVLDWESGSKSNSEHVFRIALHHNVSADWLLGLDDRRSIEINSECITQEGISLLSMFINSINPIKGKR